MESSNQLANRYKEVMLDGKWIANTNFKAQIETVNWKQATTVIGGLNSIAALTFHLNYYTAGILNVLKGGALEIRDQFSYDLPPIQAANDWDKLRADCIHNAEQLVLHVSAFPDEKLDTPFVLAQYGNYRRNLEGVIEHCYYHLDQVVLLRKLIEQV